MTCAFDKVVVYAQKDLAGELCEGNICKQPCLFVFVGERENKDFTEVPWEMAETPYSSIYVCVCSQKSFMRA